MNVYRSEASRIDTGKTTEANAETPEHLLQEATQMRTEIESAIVSGNLTRAAMLRDTMMQDLLPKSDLPAFSDKERRNFIAKINNTNDQYIGVTKLWADIMTAAWHRTGTDTAVHLKDALQDADQIVSFSVDDIVRLENRSKLGMHTFPPSEATTDAPQETASNPDQTALISADSLDAYLDNNNKHIEINAEHPLTISINKERLQGALRQKGFLDQEINAMNLFLQMDLHFNDDPEDNRFDLELTLIENALRQGDLAVSKEHLEQLNAIRDERTDPRVTLFLHDAVDAIQQYKPETLSATQQKELQELHSLAERIGAELAADKDLPKRLENRAQETLPPTAAQRQQMAHIVDDAHAIPWMMKINPEKAKDFLVKTEEAFQKMQADEKTNPELVKTAKDAIETARASLHNER